MKRWLPFVFWLILVGGIIALADSGRFSDFFGRVDDVPLGDKAGHFFLVGMLGLLLSRAFGYRTGRLGRFPLQLGVLVIGLLSTGEEFSQIWIASRSFDLGDLTANLSGLACAELLARRWKGPVRETDAPSAPLPKGSASAVNARR